MQLGGGRGAPVDPSIDDWVLNDEAMKNLGYMQMKKTRDTATSSSTAWTGNGRGALTLSERFRVDAKR